MNNNFAWCSLWIYKYLGEILFKYISNFLTYHARVLVLLRPTYFISLFCFFYEFKKKNELFVVREVEATSHSKHLLFR